MKTPLHFFFSALVLFILISFSNFYSQTAPLEYYIQTYEFESETYDGQGIEGASQTEYLVGTIEMQNAPWVQLRFSKMNLGSESYVIIKSLYDGKWQKLDAVTMEQWNNYSAFFNGSGVEIRLFVGQMDQDVFIKVIEVN